MQKSGRIGLVLTMVIALSGCASFIAQTTGTAPLGTDTGVRSFSQVLTDNAIERTAKVNLYKLDPRFKFSRINMVSFHSAVLLTGQVSDAYLKQLAEDNVKAMSDVKTVHNYIAVGDKINYNTIMQDGVVTANIRRQLLATKGIADNKVKVQTEDGVVYVLGKLTPSETQILLDIVKNTPNIVRVVTLLDSLTDAGVPTNTTAMSTSSTNDNNLSVTSAAPTAIDETPVAIDPEQAAPDMPATTLAP
jgi:osmotically-inducible protein OsmY